MNPTDQDDPTSNIPKLDSSEQRPNKLNWSKDEYLWFWLDEIPSEFEKAIATQFGMFEKGETIFVSVFSCLIKGPYIPWILQECLFDKLQLPLDRSVSFFEIDQKLEVNVPVSYLTYTSDRKGNGGPTISASPRKYIFEGETLVLFASRATDYRKGSGYLNGHDDIIGYITLAFGHLLSSKKIFSSFFSLKRQKFISSDYKLIEAPVASDIVVNFNALSGLRELDAQDDRTHTTFWFVGRAFRSSEISEKIIFYWTALEIISGGKRVENFFGKVYSKDGELYRIADGQIKLLRKTRGHLLHEGKPSKISIKWERAWQFIIIDGVFFYKFGSKKKFALSRSYSILQLDAGED